MELAIVESICPSMASLLNTPAARGIRFHLHLPTLATAGGWLADRTWCTLPDWNEGALRDLFQMQIFSFLRRRELLSGERKEMILSWSHSGFNVHIAEAIAPDDKESLTNH